MTTKHTPKRCTKCKWIHEADSVKGTSFQGVELCPLHAAAPELLEACRLALGAFEANRIDMQQNAERKLNAAIAKAEGK